MSTGEYPARRDSYNIARIERKADALINGMATKLQTVIDALKKPKWVPAEA
jgi:hypothetical protein